MKKLRSLAIIPARGGSKRIERKNVKDFAGKPIIAYSIGAAIDSGCFDTVMVSTDDAEIAEAAAGYGAEIPFMRSAGNSDDHATTADVIREVIGRYREEGIEFDVVCCIYATAPFITAERLRRGAAIIETGRAQGAFTCVAYSYPTQRCLVCGADGRIRMKFPEYAAARSQDLEPTYHDAGQFYFSTVKAFEESGSLWGPDTVPIILPELEVQDLDTPTDWLLAEMKYNLLALPGRITTVGYRFIPYPDCTTEDHARLLEERNAEDVRKFMINKEVITPERHAAFVKALRGRRDKQYYMVTDREGNLVGSVNLERIGSNDGRNILERGIFINADQRGKGHARRLLTELYDCLASSWRIDGITTRVMKDNRASLALEASLGAEAVGEEGDLILFSLPLK